MIGYPDETESEMKETLNLNKRIAPNGGVCSFFYPYKKTKLYEICKERKKLMADEEILDITNYLTSPSIKMSASEKEVCIKYQKEITSYLNKQLAITEKVVP